MMIGPDTQELARALAAEREAAVRDWRWRFLYHRSAVRPAASDDRGRPRPPRLRPSAEKPAR